MFELVPDSFSSPAPKHFLPEPQIFFQYWAEKSD
jgi:hypothetical protein